VIYYRECPRCGAHLDPGEICDCTNPGRTESEPRASKEKTAPGAANTQDGNAGKVLMDLIPASSVPENKEESQV